MYVSLKATSRFQTQRSRWLRGAPLAAARSGGARLRWDGSLQSTPLAQCLCAGVALQTCCFQHPLLLLLLCSPWPSRGSFLTTFSSDAWFTNDGPSAQVTQQEKTCIATSPLSHHRRAKEQDVGPEKPKLHLKHHTDLLLLPTQGLVESSDKYKPVSLQSCVYVKMKTLLFHPLWSVV